MPDIATLHERQDYFMLYTNFVARAAYLGIFFITIVTLIGCNDSGLLGVGETGNADGVTYIYTIGDDGGLHKITDEGDLVWTITLHDDYVARGLAISPEGTIYSSAGPNIVSLSPEGEVEWTYDDLPGATDISISDDGYILALSSSELHKITPDGQRVWRYATPHLHVPWWSQIKNMGTDRKGNTYVRETRPQHWTGENTTYGIAQVDQNGKLSWYTEMSDKARILFDSCNTGAICASTGNDYIYSIDSHGAIIDSLGFEYDIGNFSTSGSGDTFTYGRGLARLYSDNLDKIWDVETDHDHTHYIVLDSEKHTSYIVFNDVEPELGIAYSYVYSVSDDGSVNWTRSNHSGSIRGIAISKW